MDHRSRERIISVSCDCWFKPPARLHCWSRPPDSHLAPCPPPPAPSVPGLSSHNSLHGVCLRHKFSAGPQPLQTFLATPQLPQPLLHTHTFTHTHTLTHSHSLSHPSPPPPPPSGIFPTSLTVGNHPHKLYQALNLLLTVCSQLYSGHPGGGTSSCPPHPHALSG